MLAAGQLQRLFRVAFSVMDPKPTKEQFADQSGSMLGTVSRQLAQMEKRDWELWSIVLGTGIVVSVGLLLMTFPSAFVKRGELQVEIRVPKEMFLGLVALLVLFNTYVVSKRLELRRVRQQLISSTIQNELVRLQSFTDPLTQVYNRRSLEDLAHRYISHARRLRKPLTFLLVDVDDFKQVNTRFGHLIGDFVIAEIASLLRGCVRGCDAIIRYGGDEFLLVLADTDHDGAATVTVRISKAIEEWNTIGHLDNGKLSLSVGISQWREGQTFEQVLEGADLKMYVSKAMRPDCQ